MLTLYPFLSVLSISCIYIFFSLATRHPVNFSFFPANSLALPPASMACLPPRHPHIPTSCLQPQYFQHDMANLSWNMLQQWAEKTWPKLSRKKLPNDSEVWSDWICEPSTWPPPQVLSKYQIVSRILEFNPRPEAVWCQQSSSFNIRENYGSVRKCKAGWSLHSKTAV